MKNEAAGASPWRKFVILASIVIPLGVFCPQRAQAGNTIVVSANHAQCPNSQAATIQGGVNLAGPGDSVLVCAATYVENVIVAKAGLRIIGKKGAKLVAPNNFTNGFSVLADNVQIKGFEISGFCAPNRRGEGIFVGGTDFGDLSHPANGAIIENNNIHDNCDAVALHKTKDNVVRHNKLHHNHNITPTTGGMGVVGWGGQGAAEIGATNATRPLTGNQILSNRIHDNGRIGISIGGCADNNCSSLGNPAVEISGLEIVGNTIDTHDTGILLDDTTGHAQIAFNVVRRGRLGINFLGGDHVWIGDNTLAQNHTGLYAAYVTDSSLDENLIQQSSGDGIEFHIQTADNTARENTSKQNQADGIHVYDEPGVAGNDFQDNTLTGNSNFDAQDDTHGGGTAGTADTWDENGCTTDSPKGLCQDRR
jgi:nitrous oxidase accessory protein NosD